MSPPTRSQSGLRRRDRRRADHHRRGLWRRLLDHAGAQPRLCDEVADAGFSIHARICRRSCGWSEEGFELSEASNTPVMLEVRIRTCHVHGQFVAKDNKKPAFTLREALENPVRDVNRIVLPPASYMHEKEKLEKRWPAAVEFIKTRKLNEISAPRTALSASSFWAACGTASLRALQQFGLADVYGETLRPALRPQRHLSPDRRRDGRVLPRQESRADGRGGRARLYRAGLNTHPAPPRHSDEGCRQGRAADGRRIYRAGGGHRGARVSCRPMRRELLRNEPPLPDPAPILAHDRVKGLAEVVPPRRRASASAARSARSSRR